MQHGHLSEFVAATLAAHAPHLAQHWQERALAATPRPASDPSVAPAPDLAHADQVVRALAASVVAATAASLVIAGEADAAQAVLSRAADAAPGQDARPVGEVMRLGWTAGTRAFEAGLSIHHVGRDADLLLAVLLADVERAVEALPAGMPATAADGVGVARRLHRATGRYGQAAVSGFVHALLRNLRDRYRTLRHDLRNPLGTIRSALSLMEDESVPAETRHGPRIRAMVARNAGSLDAIITHGLDDTAAAALLAPAHALSVRAVATAVRREVREPARLVGAEVVIDVPAAAACRVDPAALELTLTAILLAALGRAAEGDVIRVGCASVAADGADGALLLTVTVEPDPARPCGPGQAPCWDAHGLALALALAQDHGGRIGDGAEAGPADASRDGAHLLDHLAHASTIHVHLGADAG